MVGGGRHLAQFRHTVSRSQSTPLEPLVWKNVESFDACALLPTILWNEDAFLPVELRPTTKGQTTGLPCMGDGGSSYEHSLLNVSLAHTQPTLTEEDQCIQRCEPQMNI